MCVRFSWALCVLLAAAPSSAADKPKARTLKELIDLAMTKGEEKVFTKAAGEELGYTHDVNVRRITNEYQKSLHITDEYAFYVEYVIAPTGEKQPAALIWRAITINKKKKDREYYDGWSFRTNLDGIIQNAAHGFGYSDHVEQKSISSDSRKVKKLLKKEINFFLNEPAILESNK